MLKSISRTSSFSVVGLFIPEGVSNNVRFQHGNICEWGNSRAYGNIPFKVRPNPLECHFFLHKTYSENPPGPAQISAK